MIQLIKRLIWPFITCVAFLSVMALWFGLPKMERNLEAQVAAAIENSSWAFYRLDGRDVILSGRASDQSEIDAVLAAVSTLPAVQNIESNMTLIDLVAPFTLSIERDNDSIVLRGYFPANLDRDSFLKDIEAENQGLFINDYDLQIARGADVQFEQWIETIKPMISVLDQGMLVLKDNHLTIQGKLPIQDLQASCDHFENLIMQLEHHNVHAINQIENCPRSQVQ